MTYSTRHNSHSLPPHVARDPDYMAWQLERHSEQLMNHDVRLTLLEKAKSTVSFMASIPWAQVVPALVALVMMLLGNLNLEQAVALFKSLRG
jgi:hypothetical protein